MNKIRFIFHFIRHRIPLEQWWLNIRPLCRILGKHQAVFTTETELNEYMEKDCIDELDDSFSQENQTTSD
jgi:hypothetical protein